MTQEPWRVGKFDEWWEVYRYYRPEDGPVERRVDSRHKTEPIAERRARELIANELKVARTFIESLEDDEE